MLPVACFKVIHESNVVIVLDRRNTAAHHVGIIVGALDLFIAAFLIAD